MLNDQDQDQNQNQNRPRDLPSDEMDDDRTAGAGILSQGGTSIDRGTGELGGQAQGGRVGTGDDGSLDTAAGDGSIASNGDDLVPDFGAAQADAALGHDEDRGPADR